MRVRVRRESVKKEVNGAADFSLAGARDAAQVSAMTVYRLDRRLIRVSGPDCVDFLQNLLTQNVAAADAGAPQYAALLSPQGKLIADMLLWSDSDEDEAAIIIECDPARAEDLQRRLTLYKLRADVAIDDVSQDFDLLFAPTGFEGGAVDPRLPDGSLGWRDLSPLPPGWTQYEDGATAFNALRIAAGVPDLAKDAEPEEIFAGEALLEELHGVDFQKGCFVGQENVSRMKRRATTRRKLCRIAFAGEPIAALTPIRAGDAEIGSVRSTIATRGLALLRLDRALEAQARGEKLVAGDREIALDPPAWLILPQGKAAPATGED